MSINSDALRRGALRIDPGVDEAPERAGQNRQRQRDHDAPQREVGAENRQLPRDRAAIADQRPAHDHRNRRAEIGADGEQGCGHRINGERPARQDSAERRADQQSLQAGFRAKRSRHFFVRQNFRDERAEQAAREHARHDAAEQREVMGQYLEHPIEAVAAIDQGRADHDQHGDEDHRPADRLADSGGTRLGLHGVIGGRRVF